MHSPAANHRPPTQEAESRTACRFWEELTMVGPRLPITTDSQLFAAVATLGNRLLYWHTYGERNLLDDPSLILFGNAVYAKAIKSDPYPSGYSYDADTGTVTVVSDAEHQGFCTGVSPKVWEYGISGFQPVQSWLAYRMATRAGRAGQVAEASPDSLDAIRPTVWPDQDGMELLRLLWAVERTVEAEAEAATLLHRVLASDRFLASELPTPTDTDRKPLVGGDDDPPDELPEDDSEDE